VPEDRYQRMGRQELAWRLRTGRMIHRFFGKPAVTDLFITARTTTGPSEGQNVPQDRTALGSVTWAYL